MIMKKKRNDYIIVENFLENIVAERGMSPNTTMAYKKDVLYFLSFIKKTYNKNLSQITIQEILSYIDSIKDLIGPATLLRRISSLRTFCKFLYTEGVLKQNPLLHAKLSRKPTQKLPSSLSRSDVERILKDTNITTYRQIRDGLLFQMLYGCGLRISELLNLKINNIKKDADGFCYVLVKGKGERERIVPIANCVVSVLEKMLSKSSLHNQTNKRGEQFIFINDKKTPLTRQYAARIIKKIAIKNNISHENISPHKLRHTFAVHLLEEGMDIRLIQELLGHKNITTTQIYVNLNKKTIKDILYKNHPLSDKKTLS